MCDPEKVCSVCEKLRDRQYVLDREWLRMKTNTLDGKCIECMPLPRCANGFRRWGICDKEKLHEDFTMCGVAHGYRTDRQACDTCIKQEDVKKQNMSKRNKAHVQITQDGNSAPHIDNDTESYHILSRAQYSTVEREECILEKKGPRAMGLCRGLVQVDFVIRKEKALAIGCVLNRILVAKYLHG